MESNKKNGIGTIVGAIAGIVALITGIASITRPLQYQMEALEARLMRMEARTNQSIADLDRKLQLEIAAQAKLSASHDVGFQELQKDSETRSQKNVDRIQAHSENIGELRERVAVLEDRSKTSVGGKE